MLKRKNILDYHEEIDSLYKAGLPKGASTGWSSVDELYTVAKKQWTVVTGAPSSGKSEWLDAMMINLIHQDWQIIYFSPENQPHELHAAKLLEKWIGMPFGDGPMPRMSRKQYQDAQIELASKLIMISVDAEFARLPSVDEIITEASHQITEWRNNGVGKNVGIVIDPWNEMDHARPSNMTETEYISQTLSIVRQFARDWDIHVWLVAHPTKMQKDKDGHYLVCKLWDISGSAHWNNKADNGITVHRDYETGTTTIYVLKVRFKHVGKPGACDLMYDRVTGRYIDPNGRSTTYRESECPI